MRILSQEFTRLQGLKILKNWFQDTDNQTIKMDILEIFDTTNFTSRRPYIDAGIMELLETNDPEMFKKFLKLPEGKNRFLKKFNIEEMLEREQNKYGRNESESHSNSGSVSPSSHFSLNKEQLQQLKEKEREIKQKRMEQEKQRIKATLERRSKILMKLEKEKKAKELKNKAALLAKALKQEKKSDENRRKYLDKLDKMFKQNDQMTSMMKPHIKIDHMKLNSKIEKFLNSQEEMIIVGTPLTDPYKNDSLDDGNQVKQEEEGSEVREIWGKFWFFFVFLKNRSKKS